MPTYRNDGERAIVYTETKGKDIIIFEPGKEIQLTHWIPYQRLGLRLVDEDYPPVPETMLISGEFRFERGMERKFSIEPCVKYELAIKPVSGAVRVYLGSSKKGRLISQTEYIGVQEWQYAPYIRVICESESSTVSLDATLKE